MELKKYSNKPFKSLTERRVISTTFEPPALVIIFCCQLDMSRNIPTSLTMINLMRSSIAKTRLCFADRLYSSCLKMESSEEIASPICQPIPRTDMTFRIMCLKIQVLKVTPRRRRLTTVIRRLLTLSIYTNL